MLRFLAHREITSKVPVNETLTTLVPCVTQVAVTISHRASAATGNEKVSVADIDPNFQDKDTYIIRLAHDSTIKVVKLSARPIHSAAHTPPPLLQKIHSKKVEKKIHIVTSSQQE